MTKLMALLCALAFAVTACAHVKPVVTDVIVCSGKTIPAPVAQQVEQDILSENWADLAANIVPDLSAGWADIICIYEALKASNPSLSAHFERLKAGHVELRAASSGR